jgi:hypothetical protein
MKVSTTIIVFIIAGSCLTFGILDACSRETRLARARSRVNSLLTTFPELADEVRNGTLGPNRNSNNSNQQGTNQQGTNQQGTNQQGTNQQGTNQQGTTNNQQSGDQSSPTTNV